MVPVILLALSAILFALAAFDIPKTLPLGLCAMALALLVERWLK